jgi:hypothetical protein
MLIQVFMEFGLLRVFCIARGILMVILVYVFGIWLSYMLRHIVDELAHT